MSSLVLSSSLFLNNYGPKSRHGTSIAVSLKSNLPVPPVTDDSRSGDLSGLAVDPTSQRHLVLNLDISGSMTHSMGDLQIALMTLKTLLGSAFGTTVLVSVVVFNNRANVVFSHCLCRSDTSTGTTAEFDTMVSRLKATGGTNMASGLECCYALVREVTEVAGRQFPTWLVTMSDGDPNEGPYQTRDRFAESVDSFKASNVATTITLGYGTSHRPDVLSALGNYTHISTPEQISQTMALCVLETLRTVAMSVGITLPTEAPSDGMIAAAPSGKTIYGRLTGEVVTAEMPLYLGVMPYGDATTTRALGFVHREVVCRGFDINCTPFELRTQIVDGGETATLEFVVEYFRGEHSRMISRLSLLKTHHPTTRTAKFDELTREFEEWPSTVADLSVFPRPSGLVADVALTQIQCFRATVESLIERLRTSPYDYHHVYQAQATADTQRMFSAEPFDTRFGGEGVAASPLGPIAQATLEEARLAATSVSASAAITGHSAGDYGGYDFRLTNYAPRSASQPGTPPSYQTMAADLQTMSFFPSPNPAGPSEFASAEPMIE